jgi:hypothetical protein
MTQDAVDHAGIRNKIHHARAPATCEWEGIGFENFLYQASPRTAGFPRANEKKSKVLIQK